MCTHAYEIVWNTLSLVLRQLHQEMVKVVYLQSVLCSFQTQAAEKEAHKKEEAKKIKKLEKAKQKKGQVGAADSTGNEKSPRKQKGSKRTKTAPKQSGHVFFESSSDEEGVGPVAKKPRGKSQVITTHSPCNHAHVLIHLWSNLITTLCSYNTI